MQSLALLKELSAFKEEVAAQAASPVVWLP